MLSGYNPDVEAALPHPSSQLTMGRRGEIQRRDAGENKHQSVRTSCPQKEVGGNMVRLMELGEDRLFSASANDK